MINSRKLDDLDPEVKSAAVAMIAEARGMGIDLRPICTFRDFEYQGTLYAIGRTVDGSPCSCGKKLNPIGTCSKHPRGLRVTNAGPGESWHNWRLAVDLAPFDTAGKPIWVDEPLWKKLGLMGEARGFEWGGRWKGVDGPHFQMRGCITISQMLARHPHGLPNA